MKRLIKKLFCGVVLVGLLCSISGCGRANEGVSASDSETVVNTETDAATTSDASEEPPTEVVLSAEDVPLFDNVEEYLSEDWQKAYYAKMTEVRAENEILQEKKAEGEPVHYDIVFYYYLYDIDKDGIPELLLNKGGDEASSTIDIYTYQDGEVCFIENMGSGHASFFSYPDENAMLVYWAHMLGVEINKITIQDGTLEMETLASEHVTEDEIGPQISDYAKNAERLNYYWIETDLPLVEYGMDRPLSATEEISCDSDLVKERIMQVFRNNGMLYGVCGDGFDKTIGYVSFEEYCAPKMVGKYNKMPMETVDYTWCDLDENGQPECILTLKEEPGGFDGTAYVILSLQGDVVYAYSDRFALEIENNGIFTDSLSAYRYSFYRDQCYQYYVY